MSKIFERVTITFKIKRDSTAEMLTENQIWALENGPWNALAPYDLDILDFELKTEFITE